MIENRKYGYYQFEHPDEENAIERYMWCNFYKMKLSSRIKLCWLILTRTSPKWIWDK